ncbi:hypothetical protein D3C72_2448650 [compost metagenome]
MRDVPAVGNKNQHHFTSAECLLPHHMTKQATACLFVIGADPEAAADLFDTVHNFIIVLVLNQTGLHIDDAVTALGVKAPH